MWPTSWPARAVRRGEGKSLCACHWAQRGWRIVRQWLLDSLLLVLLGQHVWGSCIRCLGRALHAAASSAGVSDTFKVAPSGAVLLFTACISILSTIVFGLAPALRATALDPAISLKAGGSQASIGGSRARLRKALVIAQVAFSAVLVVMAGLFAHSLAGLRSINPGFTYQSVMTFALDYPRAWKDDDKNRFLGTAAGSRGSDQFWCCLI